MVTVSRIHSIVVNPIFSIVERGREAAFSVSVSVSPVRKSSTLAIKPERKYTGKVSGTRHPVIITSEDNGTIIILDKMNHVGNLLNNIIVRGSVPAWAIKVTAADCHIRSGIR